MHVSQSGRVAVQWIAPEGKSLRGFRQRVCLAGPGNVPGYLYQHRSSARVRPLRGLWRTCITHKMRLAHTRLAVGERQRHRHNPTPGRQVQDVIPLRVAGFLARDAHPCLGTRPVLAHAAVSRADGRAREN
jgi:hypothetical protein